MKKLLLFIMFVSSCTFASAQTVILDFESAATSAVFTHFGNTLDGTVAPVIANPNATGINESSMVTEYVDAAGGEVWAGAFAPLTTPIIAQAGGKLCMDVHMDHIGNVLFKLEQAANGEPTWEFMAENTVMNEWEQICVSFDELDAAGSGMAAAGVQYGQAVVFFDFGVVPDADVTSYFDNLVVDAAVQVASIYDWETDDTSKDFIYFGSTLDGSTTTRIDNPNATGINESSMVMSYIKPANSEPWAGAFASEPQPTVDAVTGGKICIDFHSDHIGNLMLKLEQSSTGAPDWELIVENTVVNEWEQLCFSLDEPGTNAAPAPAGNTFGQLVLFADMNMVFDADQTYYMDNLVAVLAGGPPPPVDVTFTVDMTNYTGAYTTVFLSGSFNEWFGDANPMTDNGDGTWSTTINLAKGNYEYKFQVDEWADSEQFAITDECVVVINDGEFVNRRIAISDEGALPTQCWGSCYACGADRDITFNVGVPEASPDGVYIAGGAGFGPPGGNFRMSDPDGDGVFSLTINRATGFSSYYTIANGNCPDYSCKENIAGQECSDPDNFDDRFLDDATTEVNTCFGECTTTTASCSTGTDDLESDNTALLVYPSYVQDVMELSITRAFVDGKVAIYGVDGSLVYSSTTRSSQVTIDATAFASGIYIVNFTSEEFIATQKVVKR